MGLNYSSPIHLETCSAYRLNLECLVILLWSGSLSGNLKLCYQELDVIYSSHF